MLHLVPLLVLLAAPQAPVRPGAARRPATTAPAPAPTPTPARPPAPAGLSWEDADYVVRTLERVERRAQGRGSAVPGETVVVTERQLNSYLTLALGPRMPAGVSGLQLRLQKDRLAASALVDLDRVKQKLPPGAGTGLLTFLGGTLPVELLGRLTTANGQGRVDIEQATVGGVSLPASLVGQLVSMSTKSAERPQGFDILAPFALPWSARQVRLEPGRASVDLLPRP